MRQVLQAHLKRVNWDADQFPIRLHPFSSSVSANTAPDSMPIAGRYRLVALLGRGGMGEVYRADDLALDQPIALKFLPERDMDSHGGDGDTGATGHDDRLAQLHNELRVARQVSHKNVCRLYDLGDADGRRFLTMRRTSVAIAAWLLVGALFQASPALSSGTSVWIAAAYQACVIAVVTVMVVRYGLLVTAVAFAVGNFLEDIPLTLSLSQWTATTSNVTLAIVLAVTFFGFYAARAGQPLFGKLEVR